MLGSREAVRQTKIGCGGVTQVESSAQMPRGTRQAKFLRKTITSTQQQFSGENADEVLFVLFRMKEDDNFNLVSYTDVLYDSFKTSV